MPMPPPTIEVATAPVEALGLTWWVRDSDAPTGAGPSLWSHRQVSGGSEDLTLRLAPGLRSPIAAEVMTPVSRRGCVAVELQADPPVETWPADVVLGVFLYRNDRRELDFEVSRWGEPDADNAQFVVAPAHRGPIHRFDLGGDRLSVVLGTGGGRSRFQVRSGQQVHGFAGPLRRPRPRWLHVNLWTHQATPIDAPITVHLTQVTDVPCPENSHGD